MSADKAVADIIRDLDDRRGLGHEWRAIDPDIQQEIHKAWARLVAAAYEAPRWVPVAERLPEPETEVLAVRGSVFWLAVVARRNGLWYDENEKFIKPSHWMPLPPWPEG